MHLALFPRRGDARLVRNSRSREPARKPGICVALSVDTGRPVSALTADAQGRLRAVSSALFALCGELDLPATWGISEPLTSPLVDRLTANPLSSPPHEIAVRLDPLWSIPKSRRMLLGELLTRYVRKAELSGLPIATVFADEALVAGNYDLLVKRGITSLRRISAGGNRRGGAWSGPRQLRYGLWEYGVCHASPERPLVPRRIHGLLTSGDRAVSAGSTCVFHLSLETSQMADGNRWTWRNIERTLRLVARLRNNEGLRVEPLRKATGHLVAVPAAAPQRSILRRAA
jgi:hypothetical protein